MEVTYNDIYHNFKNEDYLIKTRLELVRYANDYGVKPASRFFRCSKNTVKRWCKRYSIYGIKGLKNLSSRPHHLRTTISSEDIEKISSVVVYANEHKKHITVNNVRKKTKIFKYSDKSINRYINKALGKKRRNRKHDPTNGNSIDFKKNLKPFELVQVDIKYLTDIDNLKPYFKNRNLVRYEITARDVASGFAFVSYCNDKSLYSTNLFIRNVFYPFLKSIPGLNLKDVTVQTDSGSEFTNRRTKTLGSSPKVSLFTDFVECKFKRHKTNIPGHCTADSEVESFHWSIERDCLAWEDITDNNSLLFYVNSYLNDYNNTVIKKRGYSPIEKIKEYFDISSLEIPKAIIL